MITAEIFKEKLTNRKQKVENFVENKLKEILNEMIFSDKDLKFQIEVRPDELPISLPPWSDLQNTYILQNTCIDMIIEELRNRGFKDMKSEYNGKNIIFTFTIDQEPKKDEFNEKKSCDKEMTRDIIKKYFSEIDELIKENNFAVLTINEDDLENPVLNGERIHYSMHWYWVGKVLQEQFGYVIMERFDKYHESVERKLQSDRSTGQLNIDVYYFKFKIYKDKSYMLNHSLCNEYSIYFDPDGSIHNFKEKFLKD